MTVDVKQMKSLALAYMGDAVYEVHVRRHLILYNSSLHPNDLNREAVRFVAAEAQAAVVWHWLDTDFLTYGERRIVARARNAKSGSKPKNTDIQTYRYSTGFEALIGYYDLLPDDERKKELIEDAIQFTEERRARK